MTAKQFIDQAKAMVAKYGKGNERTDTEIYSRNGREIAEVIVLVMMPWGCDIIFHASNNGDHIDDLLIDDLKRYLELRKN